MVEADATEHRALLIDVNADGAGLRFDAPDLPSLAVGGVVTVLFGSRASGAALALPAVVRYRREEAPGRRYGMKFDDPAFVEKELPPALARLFNRRAAYRVGPREGEPIEVTLEGFAQSGEVVRTSVPLFDISSSGMGVIVPVGFETRFADSVQLRVSFELPGFEDLFNLGGVIHYRKSAEGGVHYGIGFDPDRTMRFAHQRKAITEYVVIRYREELAEKQ